LMNARLCCVLMLASALGGVASAHHSFAAEYDSNQPITLSGTLTKIEWTNPHGRVYIDVKGDDGKVTNWGVEYGSQNALLRRGVRRTDFPLGISLVVKGYRAKSGSPVINGSSVKLPDGRDLYTVSSNPIAPGREKK